MSEDKEYKDGDIVWVKLGNNWWPGEVIDAHRHPDGIVTNIKRKLYCIVKFFNENAYEYVSNVKQIYPFQCPKKAEFLKKGLSLYKSGNKFMEKFPEDVEVAERLTRHQVPSVYVNDRPDSIVKAILGQPLVLNCEDEYYGSSDYREKRKSSESITKIINITPTKISNTSTSPSQQQNLEHVSYSSTKSNKNKTCNLTTRPSLAGAQGNHGSTLSTASIVNNNTYRCNICDFSSVRQNVMILHRKMHSSRNGSSPMANQNTSFNRCNTKVNKPTAATTVVKTPTAVLQMATNISCLNTSLYEAPAIATNTNKTNDQSPMNSSSNESSLTDVTDTSSDVEISATNLRETQIRRSMRRNTKTLTDGGSHSATFNGSTLDIDLPENKPIKKIPKKRDFVDLNAIQDDEISSQTPVEVQTETNTTTETAASRPATPEEKANAEEIRKMLMEDWSDDDETSADNENKIASASRRNDSNNGIVPSPAGPTLTSTPCSGLRTTNSTRIRNIPKKDRRDVILHDFGEVEQEHELPQSREVIHVIGESSNSSAVEVIEDQTPAVIEINDEDDEVNHYDNVKKVLGNRKPSVNSGEHGESNEKSSLVASILSCFDFQASDDEDDNDSSANPSVTGSCSTTTAAHFKKKYLSSEKTQHSHNDANITKSTNTQQQQNDEIAEKDQQLTAEIEKLLAITQPPPSDLLASTNSIEESLSVKDLPIKEREKRIFKSRNRSRIEDKSTISISTDESFNKSLSPNKLDNNKCNIAKTISTENQSLLTEPETIQEILLNDIIQIYNNVSCPDHTEDNKRKDVVAEEVVIVSNNSKDNISEKQMADTASDEILYVGTGTSIEKFGKDINDISTTSSSDVIIVEPQTLTENELTPIISDNEIPTDAQTSATNITASEITSEKDEDTQTNKTNETSLPEEHLPIDEKEEPANRESNIEENNLQLTDSTQTTPLAEEKNEEVCQILNEAKNTDNGVENSVPTHTRKTDHDNINRNSVQEKVTTNDNIDISTEIENTEGLKVTAPETNKADEVISSATQKVLSIKLNENSITSPAQPDASVSEVYTATRLITTTPPTDENSSMGASDTGAEFGSPTSMLSEERLPTFRFNRNDTSQREVETNPDAIKESKQLLKSENTMHKNALLDDTTTAKNINNINKQKKISSDSRNEKIRGDVKSDENHACINNILNTKEKVKTTEFDEIKIKHRRLNVSPNIGSMQHKNRRTKHSHRIKENNVSTDCLETSELSPITTSVEAVEVIIENSVDHENETEETLIEKSPTNLMLISKEPNNSETSNSSQIDSSSNKDIEDTTTQQLSSAYTKLTDKKESSQEDPTTLFKQNEADEERLRTNSCKTAETASLILDVTNKNAALKGLNTEAEDVNTESLTLDGIDTNLNILNSSILMTRQMEIEENSSRSPKKRSGDIVTTEAKHKRQDSYPVQSDGRENDQIDVNKDTESNIHDNVTVGLDVELSGREPCKEKQGTLQSSTNVTEKNEALVESVIDRIVVTENTTHYVSTPSPDGIPSSSQHRIEDLIIECTTIFPDATKPTDQMSSDKNDLCIDIDKPTMATKETIVEYETISQEKNIVECIPETEPSPDFELIDDAETNPIQVPTAPSVTTIFENELHTVSADDGERSSLSLHNKCKEDFAVRADDITKETAKMVEVSNAIEMISNISVDPVLKEAVSQDNSSSEETAADCERDHRSLFQERAAIKRRKTICYELAEFGLKIGESTTRKRQVIDFEDTMPEDSQPARRTNERKMTLPATFDFNSQFKSFKPRRKSSIDDNMKHLSKNSSHTDEDLHEEDSSKVFSELAAKQIGIDSKGNKYVVIKDITSSSHCTGSGRKNRLDSTDSSLFMAQRNGRTLKRKSSESKSTSSKFNTKASSAITSRRLSLPAENPNKTNSASSGGCVSIKPKITRDQVISSLNDNQLSTAQQQLMQLQQQQQQQQQIQSLSIPLNKQPPNRLRKTHRTQQQSCNQMQVHQIQLQQQPQANVLQQQQQLMNQLAPGQQNVLQLVTPQLQPANEGFIIATAASSEDDSVIDSNTQLIALPTQPYPGYTETFLLCKVNGNTCKPVDNVPLYLNHQLNELVPIPLEVLENAPKLATNDDGTIEINQNANTQHLVVEDKTTGHITIEEVTEIADAEISNQDNIIHEQFLQDSTLTGAVNEEDVTADLSTNNGVLLNIEGQQVLLDAATFEHLLANPDANTQLISDDGTEYVLTHEVLQALYLQQQQEQQQQQQQQQQQMLGQSATGSNNDIIAVAMAGSDLYGNGVLTIDTSQGVQLLDGSGGMVFQQPPSALVQQHLTPPAVVTNAVLDQSPIMSTLEVPSGSRMQQVPHCITVPSIPIVAPSSVILGNGGTHPNLEDSLAAIGVTAQTSAASSSLGLPITVTDPNIASKVTSAGPLNEILQFVSHRPATAAATAAAVAAAALAGETRLFND